MQHLEIARRAARAGGEIVTRYFRDGVAMGDKQGLDEDAKRQTYNLVSDADIESEKAIVDVIRQEFPDHAVLGEESHHDDVQSEHLWVIDPLDGTNNFAHNIPHFAISVAYYRDGQPFCGVIFNPIRDDWFEAVRGDGAKHNGRPVHVSESSRLDEVLIGTGFFYDRGAIMEATLAAMGDLFRQQIHGMRRFGTASLDLAMVGTGSFGAFYEYELAPWDFAAGRLFVEEAGGRVTTCTGEPMPLSKTGILASNGRIHETVLEIVRRNCPT